MNLIFFFLALLICGIFWFSLRLVSKPHKYVLLENTVAPQHIDDPAVHVLVKNYRQRVMQLIALFSVASLVFLFNLSDSITITLFFLHLVALIGCGQLLLIHYIGKMRQLIVDKNWLLPIDAVRIDTKVIQQKNRRIVPLISLLPALLIMIVGFFISYQMEDSTTFMMIGVINSFMLLLFIGLWWMIKNLPVRGISGDSHIDQQINDLTKYYWSLTIVVLATGISLLLSIPFVSLHAAGFLGTMLSYLFILLTIGLIITTFVLLLRLRNKQDLLLNQAEKPRYHGEDIYWRYGVYINTNDTRLFVPDRVGMNIGLNLGKRSGQILSVATLIILIGVMLITIVPLYQLDFTPDALQAEITDEAIVFSAPLTATTFIQIDSIEEVALVDALPKPIVKKIGTATNNYALGSFLVDGQNARLYLDFQSPQFLKIQTEETIVYYANKDPQKTKALYQQLVDYE